MFNPSRIFRTRSRSPWRLSIPILLMAILSVQGIGPVRAETTYPSTSMRASNQRLVDHDSQSLSGAFRSTSSYPALGEPSEATAVASDSPGFTIQPSLTIQAALQHDQAQDQPETLRGESWLEEPCEYCPEWSLFPEGLIYHSYLAGAKESRFRSVWNYEKNEGPIWDITLGGRVGLIRYGSPSGTRPTGWQLDIEGAGQPRLDWETGNELVGADFRFGTPLTYGNELHQVKFAYYHLSSHVGDEFLVRNPGFMRFNYSRDVLVWGHSYTPNDDLRFYAEAGWAFYSDVGEPWEFQFGFEYRPTTCTGFRGAPFVALNGHLRQELDFGGNFVFQAGWAWRESPSSGLFRVGFEYYNGKDDQFSFFDDYQSKAGFGIWYDY